MSIAIGQENPPSRVSSQLRDDLAPSRVDTSVIALWLGHAGVRSTDADAYAYITIKEKALALTTPASASPGRYHPPDKILAFLQSL